MRLTEYKRVHFIGIGGAGMSAIAKVLFEAGVGVSGSDLKRSRAATLLEAMGAGIRIGHRAGDVTGADVVVVSSAIPPSNPELQKAQELGIPTLSRGEALAGLLEGSPSIVVAGTHGKTTTTSMIVTILRSAGRDPTYLVGGGLNDVGSNAKLGAEPLAVAESDESDGSFLLLSPWIAVVTNIDADHLDYWGSEEALRRGFESFIHGVAPNGAAIAPAAEGRLMEAAAVAGRRAVGWGDGGDVVAEGVVLGATRASFTLRTPAGSAAVALNVPGAHNVANAVTASAACLEAGVSLDDVATGLGFYAGVERRFQLRGEAEGVTFVDDYAHHPTEVGVALAAARRGPWRRVVAVFQPHRYSRTALLHEDFGAAFGDADIVVITDVYGAGEEPVPGVSGKLVADAVSARRPGRSIAYLPHRNDVLSYLRTRLRPGDVLITLGAGDVNTIGEEVLGRLRSAA